MCCGYQWSSVDRNVGPMSVGEVTVSERVYVCSPPSGFQASNSSGLDQGRAYSGPLGTGGFPGGPFRQRSNQHVNGHDNVYWASEETSCVAPSDSGVSAEDWTLGTEARGGVAKHRGGSGGGVAGEWGAVAVRSGRGRCLVPKDSSFRLV